MLSFSHSNQFLTGFQGNILRSTRNTYRNRIYDGGMLCEQSLQDTIRNISCFSRSEIQVLAEKSVTELNSILHGTNLNKIPNFEENLSLAYSVIHQNSHNSSGGLFGPTLLRQKQSSPLLVTARGFKTKRSDNERDKPFTKKSTESKASKEQENMMDDILKQMDISAKEKEKINIAFNSYTAGLMKNPGAEKGKKSTWEKNIRMLSNVIVTAAIIWLAWQSFNLGGFKINKGSNEISPEEIEVTFADVKGCDEAKRELQEVVEFLTNPGKFSNLGGKLPKGCLLVGPPGTGKTLLARAVAGEAGVPFFHAAGAEFDEVLVGQGARRIRDLFKAAKVRAPCVIFIDEIDSVGSKRTSSALHPYANQTINQLLSEMDGFMSNEGVIVLGATNRASDLDKALLRPGRFDTQVEVIKPDIKGRREILELYLSKIKHDDSIDIEQLAKISVGFSGADIQNMVNTAAIKAAVDGKEWVTMEDFEYSHDKATLGTDWKSRVREKSDLEITAYHEAGHTLVAYFTQDHVPVRKVTIVAKGQSGGHTAFLPENDTQMQTKAQMLARIDCAMGGRAAEELIFGKEKVTGGASSDLEGATNISEAMVKNLGMSEKIGLRVTQEGKLSPGSTELIDTEITKILNESYKRATAILIKHRRELDMLAEALLKFETLDAEDIKTIVEHKKPPPTRPQPSNAVNLSLPKIPSLPDTKSPGIPVPGVTGGAGGPPAGGEVVG